MKKENTITINDHKYTIERNYKDGFDSERIKELYTDFFDDYDYIFGDFSADKLRLKGFYDSNNKKSTSINDIKGLDKYIKNFCNYECRYFLIKKIK